MADSEQLLQGATAPRVTKQERFNMSVLNILRQMHTELRRQREGNTLCNLAGIQQEIEQLEREMNFK